MGTIVKRPRKGGGVAYLAQISIMRKGKVAFRQSQTFDREKLAAAWITKREAELSKPGALLQPAGAEGSATLADAIDRYSKDTRRAPGRTKAQVLRTIKMHDIASLRCGDITS